MPDHAQLIERLRSRAASSLQHGDAPLADLSNEAADAMERLEAERDYLLRWLGGFNAELTGLSADALTVAAFTGRSPRSYPRDTDDLGRCERAYAAMPEHLQAAALPLLEEWRESVAKAEATRASRRCRKQTIK